jgi:hypothetical protein
MSALFPPSDKEAPSLVDPVRRAVLTPEQVLLCLKTESMPASERSCFYKNWTTNKVQKRGIFRLDLHHCQNPIILNSTPIRRI